MVGSLSVLPVGAPATVLGLIKHLLGLPLQELSSAFRPGMLSHEDVLLPQEAGQMSGTPSCRTVLRVNVDVTVDVNIHVPQGPSVLALRNCRAPVRGRASKALALEGAFLISFGS